VNCPHCGWGMEIEDEGVNLDGYYATLTCKNTVGKGGKCMVSVKVNTNLLWAYENNRIKAELRQDAYLLLLSAGLIATPP